MMRKTIQCNSKQIKGINKKNRGNSTKKKVASNDI